MRICLNILSLLLAGAALAAPKRVVAQPTQGQGSNAAGPKRLDAEFYYNVAYEEYFQSTEPNNADVAISALKKSLRIKPDYPQAHFLLATVYLGRSQHSDAIRHYKLALVINPQYYQAANNLGAAYLAAGRFDDAIKLYTRLVGEIMYSTPGHGHNNLGWAHYKKGDLSKAKRHLAMATKLAPRLCPSLNNLGVILVEENDLLRAEGYLRRAVKCADSYAEPRFHLGRIRAMQGDVEAARELFKTCIGLSDESSLSVRCQEHLSRLPASASD